MRIEDVESCPRRRWSRCDEPTDAVGNLGRTGGLIFDSQGLREQQLPAGLTGLTVLVGQMHALAIDLVM